MAFYTLVQRSEASHWVRHGMILRLEFLTLTISSLITFLVFARCVVHRWSKLSCLLSAGAFAEDTQGAFTLDGETTLAAIAGSDAGGQQCLKHPHAPEPTYPIGHTANPPLQTANITSWQTCACDRYVKCVRGIRAPGSDVTVLAATDWSGQDGSATVELMTIIKS